MSRIYAAYALATVMTVAGIGVVIFLSAWTLHYWQAWVLLAAMLGSYGVGIIGSLVRRDPAPLPRRKPGEPRLETPADQRILVFLVALGSFALLVVPGIDHRFGWSSVPPAISLAAALLVAGGLLITYQVRQEMIRRSSATEVPPDRRMISTGPFAVVRHPMHSGTLLYQATIPVALGSWWGMVAFAVILPLSLVRIRYEEKLTQQVVADYADYARKVEYRLLPHVW